MKPQFSLDIIFWPPRKNAQQEIPFSWNTTPEVRLHARSGFACITPATAVTYSDQLAGCLTNEPRHRVPVHRMPRERAQHEDVERPLQQVEVGKSHARS